MVMKMSRKKNIALIGFMGTGKSTVARELSKKLNMKFVEMDKLIEEREGMKITEIFESKGEEYFRSCETEVLEELSNRKNIIISCGGGIVLKSHNREVLKSCSTVFLLRATSETILERVRYSKNRPILSGNMNSTFIYGLMKKREAMYNSSADVIIDTDDKSIHDICRKIQSSLG